MSDFKEPWEYRLSGGERMSNRWTLDDMSQILAIRRNDGSLVCGTFAGNVDDMRRIVACVNACRGIPTEVLQRAKQIVVHEPSGAMWSRGEV